MAAKATNRQAIEDLWRFYDEHAAQARQNETLRATVTSILSGFAGAMAAVASNDGLGTADIPVAIAVTVLGAVGFLLSLGHYGKNREHVKIMGAIRRKIVDEGGTETKAVRDEGTAVFTKDQPWLIVRAADLRWQLWALLPLLVACVGVLLIVLSSVGISAPD